MSWLHHRLTHIFADCNSHKTMLYLISELKDVLQKSIAKGVKDFPKQMEATVSAEGFLNIKCNH